MVSSLRKERKKAGKQALFLHFDFVFLTPYFVFFFFFVMACFLVLLHAVAFHFSLYLYHYLSLSPPR